MWTTSATPPSSDGASWPGKKARRSIEKQATHAATDPDIIASRGDLVTRAREAGKGSAGGGRGEKKYEGPRMHESCLTYFMCRCLMLLSSAGSAG